MLVNCCCLVGSLVLGTVPYQGVINTVSKEVKRVLDVMTKVRIH